MEKIKCNREIIYTLLSDSIIKNGDSIIYKAIDERLNRDVCIKKILIPNDYTEKEAKKAINSIMNEVHLLCKHCLNIKEIPIIFDFMITKEAVYIVMEWMEGGSLRSLLKDMSELDFVNKMVELVDILERLEKVRIYHKDIKPENIMFDQNRNLRLIDFNITMSLPSHGQGTPAYRAPEMADSTISIHREKSDMFSIGVMLYEYYTKSIPKRGEHYSKVSTRGKKEWETFIDAKQRCPQMNDKMNEIITHCMKYNPSDRYRSYNELKNQLKIAQREIKNGRRK